MPYVIIPKGKLYQVINENTGQIHSYGTTKRKAEAQVKLLKKIHGEGIHSHLKAGISTLITGRSDYSPYVKSFLNEYGNQQIVKMYIEREPLPPLFTLLADYLTYNKFSQNKGYDDLFHLRVVATLDNGVKVVVEKNHSVNIGLYDSSIMKGTQQLEIEGIFPTLQVLVDKTREKMGIKNFNNYSVSNLNCQNFILNLLRANGLNNEINEKFTMQDVKSVFNDIEYLNNMVNILTNIGYSADVLLQGGAISDYIPSKKTLYKTGALLATAYLANKALKNPKQKDYIHEPYTNEPMDFRNVDLNTYIDNPYPKHFSREDVYIHKPFVPIKQDNYVPKEYKPIKQSDSSKLRHHLYNE